VKIMDYGTFINLTIVTLFLLVVHPSQADTKVAQPGLRNKRSSEGVEEYYQDNSRYMKRPQRFSFGLGKRSGDVAIDHEDDSSEEGEDMSMDEYNYLLNQISNINKRAPYNFGLGKRSSFKREPYAFGLGKRSPYQFGLGKRQPYGFGLGKRFSLLKREPYGFGLGRR